MPEFESCPSCQRRVKPIPFPLGELVVPAAEVEENGHGMIILPTAVPPDCRRVLILKEACLVDEAVQRDYRPLETT